ncbi:hypothetical protein H6A66_06685 [Bacteroides caecigallinarum]|uniref:BACON domain-containing protein n=1 Tax=Bacteroides caecigallinarum TaxID=1411144 RepID=UPI00195DD8AB|nr:BACON domain-containing carbohydrate-binding protein [Bacteroides caecigallinarum]MBM6864855.1 hypothetical protein [Bacteroides caecigallinarum]
MKYFYHLLLCAALTFSACSEGEDNQSQLKLADGIPTEIVFGDGETNSVKEIKFVASAPWTASVKETSAARSGSEVDWLTLDKYSGNAGEITLTLTIKDNETSETRKAEIVIVCGDTTITITVEQKPSADGNEDGGNETDDSKLVKMMKFREETTNTDQSYTSDKPYIAKYKYDKEGRTIEMVAEPETGGIPRQTYTFVYSDNKIEITEVDEQPEPEDSGTSLYEVSLNEIGDAVQLYRITGSSKEKLYDFEYNGEGRLVKMEMYKGNGDKCTETISYNGSLFETYEYEDYNNEGNSDACTYEVDLETGYAHKYPNNGNIDIMTYIFPFLDNNSMLFHIGVMGKTGDYMPEAVTLNFKYSDTIKKPDIFSYEFDDKDRMTKLTIKESYDGYENYRIYEFSY